MSDERSTSRKRLFRRLRRPAVLGCGVVLLAAGGVAYATIPDAGTAVIHGCYDKTTGALRVIDPSRSQTCTTSEAALNWNARSFNWRGTWNATTAYATSDVVTLNGGTYLAKSPNTNNMPPSSVWATIGSPSYANSTSQSNESNPGTFPILISSNLTKIAQTTAMPAGNYTVNAQVTLFVDNDAQDMQCLLEDTNGNFANGYAETSGPPDSANTGTVQTVSLVDTFPNEPVNTHIILKCAKGNGADPDTSEAVAASMTATQVGRVVFNGTSFSTP